MTKVRLEAFSDGVFGIAATLLVLDIKFPDKELTTNRELNHTLWRALPNILTFIFTFIIVGIFWVGHNRIYARVKKVNQFLLWSNIVYLMNIAVIPFPAAMLAKHPFFKTSVIFYSFVLFLCGIQHIFSLAYLRKHEDLTEVKMNLKEYRNSIFIASAGPACYLIAIGSCFISPVISFIFIIIAIIFYIFLIPAAQKQDV